MLASKISAPLLGAEFYLGGAPFPLIVTWLRLTDQKL